MVRQIKSKGSDQLCYLPGYKQKVLMNCTYMQVLGTVQEPWSGSQLVLQIAGTKRNRMINLLKVLCS